MNFAIRLQWAVKLVSVSVRKWYRQSVTFPVSVSYTHLQKLVEDFFGKAPSTGVNPDEVVAIGAAVQGAVLTDESKVVVLLLSLIHI